MKVLIVGAGVGGLALGAFLRDSDIEYDIIEKMPDWNKAGFLVAVWDSGRDIFEKLGLAEEFDRAGAKVDRYSIRNGAGKILHDFDLSYFYATYGAAARVMPRGDIHRLLLEKANPANVRMGLSIESISQDADKVHVKLSNGEEKAYDIVVGADGVHSQVRALMLGHLVEAYDNWRIWYTWIDNALGMKATVVEYLEPGEFAAVLTTGSQTSVWLVAPADHAMWDRTEGRVKRLEQIFRDEKIIASGALANLRDEDIQPSDLACVQLRKWSEGRIVLVGEAAHCSGPYAGLGTTLALEDAYVLAGELMRVRKECTLSEAFEKYEGQRKARIAYADRLNKKIKFGTLLSSKPLRKVVSALIPYVSGRYLFRELEYLLRREI